MNDLHDKLHERAEAQQFSPVDLEAVVASGIRRRRGRRAATVLGSVAGFAVVAATTFGAAQLRGSDTVVAPAAQPPSGTAQLSWVMSWATGSTIHTATGDSIDVGHPIRAYVATHAGYVVLDESGEVWSVTDGTVSPVRSAVGDQAKESRLVTDGTWVGWATRDGDDVLYHYFDTSSGGATIIDRETRDADYRPDESAWISAIADGTAYTVDARGLVATQLPAPGTEPVTPKVIAAKITEQQALVDVRNGVLARYDEGLEVGTSWQSAKPLAGIMEGGGVLSPDGSMYAPDADTIKVVTTTGRDVTPQVGSKYAYFSTAYSWLDDDTVGVIAMTAPKSDVTLLTCTISTGDCSTVATGLTEGDFQLPVGQHLGG